MITFEKATSLFTYAPHVGGSCLVRNEDAKNKSVKAGERAGWLRSDGYWSVRCYPKAYLAHVIVWLLSKKEWPTHQIDHIDGNPSNNTIENLRLTKRNGYDNQQNVKLRRDSSSGYTGVSYHKQRKKYQAYITVDNKRTHLGLFNTAEEAYSAYLNAKAKTHLFQSKPR